MLAAASTPVRGASAQAVPPIAVGEPRAAGGEATFDEAWGAIRETYVDEARSEADWAALHDEFRARAAAATTPDDVRAVLRGFLARIGRSHFDLLPSSVHDRLSSSSGSAADTGTPGFEVTPIGGEAVVSRVDAGGPAAKAGVQPGWVVEAIEGEPVRRVAAEAGTAEGAAGFRLWATTQALLKGARGTTAHIRFRDGRDAPHDVEVTRARPWGEPVTLGYLPTFFAHLEDRVLAGSGGRHVHLVHFNVWMVPLSASIDRALFEARGADGVVIDLRQNPGGILSMLMGVSGHFLEGPVSLGTLRTRDSELKLLANPRLVAPDGRRVAPFRGRVAILVDQTSYSASEIFAAGMQALGRATIFGARTPGGALPAMLRRLPNGDVLEYAIGDFVTASGRRIEGQGVEPDVPVAVTREALGAGEDPVLAAAVAWAGAGPAGEKEK